MKNPDYLDTATELAETLRANEIAKHHAKAEQRLRNEPAQQIVNGQVLCVDCDEPLPEGRLKAKQYAARCIECESFQEKRCRE